MDSNTLQAFAAFAFVASCTPGPNNVLLTATGGAVGIVRGLPVLFGIVAGFAAMIFVLTLGLGEVLVSRPELLDVLRYVGVAFLLWLSWQIATAPLAEDQSNGESRTGATGFMGAALFQWVNPKAWLVVSSAIVSFLQSDQGSLPQALIFATVFVVAGIAGCLPWLAFGAYIRRWLTSPKSARGFNVLMGLTLATSVMLIIR